MKSVFVVFALILSCVAWAKCENVHCNFEYKGYSPDKKYSYEDFLSHPVANVANEQYMREGWAPFRELNWHLYSLEKAVFNTNVVEVTNEVASVSKILRAYNTLFLNKQTGEMECFPLSLKISMFEKIEYSLARMVLRKEQRHLIIPFLDNLLPDAILSDCQNSSARHSLLTFKTMLRLATEVENYRNLEGCYPLNLNSLQISEQFRKCACGRDIDYEYHAFTWVVRSRCESYEGGLRFDEYLPMIYRQRKHLDLCLSPSFNRKRENLFNGKSLSLDNKKIDGRVVHDAMKCGVHKVIFSDPSAGTFRLIPHSERQARNESTDAK